MVVGNSNQKYYVFYLYIKYNEYQCITKMINYINKAEKYTKNKKEKKMLKILYEDNHIIVVEKKPNIPSQGDKTGDIDMLTIIKQYIKERDNKPGNVYLGLIHRLDRPVGGVMVFAKTSKAAARLSEQVRNKELKKEYLVVADGKFENEKGHLENYLLKSEKNNLSKIVKEGTKNAKLAILDYKVIKYKEEIDLSVVKINLHTGRHHQIRVQL